MGFQRRDLGHLFVPYGASICNWTVRGYLRAMPLWPGRTGAFGANVTWRKHQMIFTDTWVRGLAHDLKAVFA